VNLPDKPDSRSRQYLLGEFFQSWQVSFNHAPNDLQIDSEILMDDHVAKTAGQRPNVFGVSGSEFGGESAACFTDDHQVVDNPCLNQLIAVKRVTPLAGVFLDTLNGIQDVTEPDAARLSQRHGLCQHPLSNAGTKAALGNDIHRYVQQRFKIEQQSAKIEQRAPRFHLDEEIDIAFLVVVSSRDRTEHAHIPGAAMCRHPQDFFPPPVA
jgi:hypothetical protein